MKVVYMPEWMKKSDYFRGFWCVLLLFPVFVQGQVTDTLPTPKKWYKQMKLAGIGVALGVYMPIDNTRSWQGFKNIVKNEGISKYNEDEKNTLLMNSNKVRMDENGGGTYNFRFTFKCKDTLAPYWIRFGEFGLGLRTMYNYSVYVMQGDSSMPNNRTASYRALYSQDLAFAGLDVSYTLQTPAIFNFFSLYAGATLNGGFCFSEATFTTDSRYYIGDRSNFFLPPDFDTVYQLGHNQFYRPMYMLGAYFPIGLKMNVSPKINLFGEYVFLIQTIFYQNNYSLMNYYNGFEFGMRYKFNSRGEKLRKKSLKSPPQPFY